MRLKKQQTGHKISLIPDNIKKFFFRIGRYDNKDKKCQMIQLAVSVVVLSVALMVIPTFSWLYYQRNLEARSRVNRPNALAIGAGDARAISELELSDIDTTDGDYKDIVFCVYSAYQNGYQLQLAHTTNIGFTYTIYPAQKGTSSSAENIQVEYLGKDYFFSKDTVLPGNYLNQDGEQTTAIKNDDNLYYKETYDKLEQTGTPYSNVRTNAVPMYWKTTSKQEFPETKDEIGDYINYYVLRIQWNEGIWNNKETDMVYLVAESIN